MKKTKETNTNKGITLIALVITIIVMLILVAVTISMAVNGGLFDYAGKAVGDTQNAIDAEQELSNGRINVGGTWYDSIDDYIKGKPAVTTIHSWTRSGDTFACSHCNAIYTMGQTVGYTDAGLVSTTMTAAKSGLDVYYTGKSSTYPSDANVDANGTQTIEAQDATWVVLGIEDINGDNTYETLLITTEEPVGATSEYGLYMYGAATYNYAATYIDEEGNEVEGELDRICRELYSNSEYGTARAMTIEDVNAALKYTPMGGFYNNGSALQTTGNFTTKIKDIDAIWDTLSLLEETYQNEFGGFHTPEGIMTIEAFGNKYEANGYYYYLNEDGKTLTTDVEDIEESNITPIERSTIFGPYVEGSGWSYGYWLASRGVCVSPDGAVFGCGDVFDGYAGSFDGAFFSDDSSGYLAAPFRPVVALTSKLPAVNE